MDNTDSVQDITDVKLNGHASHTGSSKSSPIDIIDMIDDNDDDVPVKPQIKAAVPTTSSNVQSSKPNAFDAILQQSKRHKTSHARPPMTVATNKPAKPNGAGKAPVVQLTDKQTELLTQLKSLLNITTSQHDRALAHQIDNENNNLDRVVGKLMDNDKYKYLFEPCDGPSDTASASPSPPPSMSATASPSPSASPTLQPVNALASALNGKSGNTHPAAADRPTWQFKLLLETTLNGTSTTSGTSILHRNEYVNLKADTCPVHTVSTTELSTKQHKKDRYGKMKVVTRDQCLHCQRRILRFCSLPPHNRELGSIARDLTNILLPLIDSECVVLEAQVLDCPTKLNIFSTVLLNVKVFVTPAIFDQPAHAKTASTLREVFDKTISEAVATNPRAEAVYDLLQYAKVKPNDASTKTDELERVGDALTEQSKSVLAPADASATDDTVAEGAGGPVYDEDTAAGTDNNDPESTALRVSKFQLDSLYASAQAHSSTLPELDEPAGLKTQLRAYQKQALHWCVQREQTEEQKQGRVEAEDGTGKPRRHPLWDEYCFVDKTVFYLNTFSFQISLQLPVASGECRGGILADEMGMGKTVMSISLIVHNHMDNATNNSLANDQDEECSDQAAIKPKIYKGKAIGNCSTLIVCPMSLVGQWVEEIKKFSNLSYLLYYGDNRNNSAKLLTQYDIVVTSYGTIASEYRQQQQHGTASALLSVEWYRVMLDEAHIIRNRKTENARSIFELKAVRRWCLTGTPIQNCMNDMFALLHFLDEQPWADYGWWHRVIAKPYEQSDARALQRLKAVLHPLMLRRTKSMSDANGNAILSLPEKVEEVVELELSETERSFYNNLFEKSKMMFDQFVEGGVALNKYMEILTLLLRLRQCCNHPFLLLGRDRTEDEFHKDIDMFVANFVKRNVSGEALSDKYVSSLKHSMFSPSADRQCCICLNDMDPNTAVLTNCGHAFDGECITPVFNENGIALCPICRSKIYREKLVELPRQSALFKFDAVKQWRHSTKTEYLLNELKGKSPDDKCLVFSQWTSMLDLIEIPLRQNGMKFLRLDGTLSQVQRERLLQQFRTDGSYTILLISLKAGGVGLNLVSANIVYFIDCWWNPAVEDQAIQRVHRIGQTKPVMVKRFIVNRTVEQRIIALQEKKKQLARSVGMSDQEAKETRVSDLMSLFQAI